MEINREPQLENMQRVKKLRTVSSKWNDFFNSLYSGIGAPCRRGVRKIATARGDGRHHGNKTL